MEDTVDQGFAPGFFLSGSSHKTAIPIMLRNKANPKPAQAGYPFAAESFRPQAMIATMYATTIENNNPSRMAVVSGFPLEREMFAPISNATADAIPMRFNVPMIFNPLEKEFIMRLGIAK